MESTWHPLFQPTSPVRETTVMVRLGAGSYPNFNPRPPCGRRRAIDVVRALDRDISTHVPRAGDDFAAERAERGSAHFNPRPPCGRRRSQRETTGQKTVISTHVPRAGDDVLMPDKYQLESPNFNPRPPCGRRRTDYFDAAAA